MAHLPANLNKPSLRLAFPVRAARRLLCFFTCALYIKYAPTPEAIVTPVIAYLFSATQVLTCSHCVCGGGGGAAGVKIVGLLVTLNTLESIPVVRSERESWIWA